MQIRRQYDSAPDDVNIEGVTVALRVGDDLYLGSHLSDRLVKMPIANLVIP